MFVLITKAVSGVIFSFLLFAGTFFGVLIGKALLALWEGFAFTSLVNIIV